MKFANVKQTLLTDSNAKIQKGLPIDLEIKGMHLAPAHQSGYNTCKGASAGCTEACLNKSGHGRFDRTQEARNTKTQAFFKYKKEFMHKLFLEINSKSCTARRKGKQLAIRLNLTSDIPWENVKHNGKNLMEHFPEVQFYDYTKLVNRMFNTLPTNYHLTFSRSEENAKDVKRVLQSGGNAAVVFQKYIPKTYEGYKVIDGTKHDARFLDGENVVVGLLPKGANGKNDESGFVIPQP